MKIFGINTHHDSSYCFLVNGNVVFHNELERFSRIKHDPNPKRLYNLIYSNNTQHVNECDVFAMSVNVDENHEINKWHQINLTLYNDQKNLQKPVYHIGHHTCHASNVYYSSGFKDAIIFTLDGGGWENNNNYFKQISKGVFKGVDNKIEPVYGSNNGNIGQYWLCLLSEVFGMSTIFDPNGDESGTLMAMAAYGDPLKYEKYFDDLSYAVARPYAWYEYHNFIKDANIYNISESEKIAYNHFYEKYVQKRNFLREKVLSGEFDKFDLAAGLQYQFERYLLDFIISYLPMGDIKNVCFSGGSMLNCVALGKVSKILKEMGYNVYCDHAPSDGGLSLGAAKYVYHHIFNNPLTSHKQHCYFGKTYTSEEVKSVITQYNNIKVQSNVELSDIVTHLMSSKIISVFNEGSESGKRALGNRSIITDPRFAFMKDKINANVKHRKSFRPFAPSVLREHVSQWFEFDIDSPYMSYALKVNDDKQQYVPAILHKDNTARLQTVTKEDNGYYYDLITMFYEKTGVPMILNTSFNDREPIVETPEHAINCFLRTNIDYLYFVKEKLLVSKTS
jgi:carbamoyltransferase